MERICQEIWGSVGGTILNFELGLFIRAFSCPTLGAIYYVTNTHEALFRQHNLSTRVSAKLREKWRGCCAASTNASQ